MSFGSRLKERRESLGITQPQLAQMLNVSKGAIGNWETDVNSPRATLLYVLFEILHCDANYLFQDEMNELCRDTSTPNEFENIVKPYRNLDDYGKATINIILKRESERIELYGKLGEKNVITLAQYESTKPPTHLIPYWEGGVSAGNGIYQLDDASCIMMTLWDTEITKQADFIIKVNGNSMEPDYHDGDKVLINRDIIVKKGEVGIFVKNGEAFIKELGDGELISRNPDFPNISVQDFDNVVCLGKVIGVLKDSLIVSN